MSVSSLHMIDISNVAEILNTSAENAIRWLKRYRITVHIIGYEQRVFEQEVHYALHMMLAKELIKKYKHQWEFKYRLIGNNPALCDLIIADITNTHVKKQATPLKNLSDSDIELIKKLHE